MRSIIGAVIAVALTGCVTSTRDGLAAYRAGDYQTAAEEFRPLADRGVALAQYNLGLMYQEGQGLPRDFAEAAMWYRLAARQGYVLAQNALGRLYARSQGVSQSYIRAYALFDLAASNGHEPATELRNTVAMLLDPQTLTEARALSQLWFDDPSLIE